MENNLLIEEMYLYKPLDSDIILNYKSIDYRLMFDGPIQFKVEENQYINEWINIAKENNNNYIINLKRSKILRFIEACNFDLKQTYKALLENFNYLNLVKDIKLNDEHLKFLNEGALYVYGRDSKYHPNFIVNVTKINYDKYPLDFFVESLGFIIEYILNNMLIDGQIENWNLIIDIGKMNLLKIPIIKIKKTINFLQNNYRGRGYKIFIVNTSYSINFIWKLVQPFLNENTLRKISLTKNSFSKEMHELINLNQLEKKYGGNLEDKIDNFYPPLVNNNNFVLENNKNQYYTKEEYKSVFKHLYGNKYVYNKIL